MIKAVELIEGAERGDRFAEQLRIAFFTQARDISNDVVLREVLEEIDIPLARVEQASLSGRAHAALAADMHAANTARISGSPTWSLNEGRQVLFGNVGYRVIQANLEEFLNNDKPGASWC
jgi:predicted DsbA family dithiol-disulfide isomerase